MMDSEIIITVGLPVVGSILCIGGLFVGVACTGRRIRALAFYLPLLIANFALLTLVVRDRGNFELHHLMGIGLVLIPALLVKLTVKQANSHMQLRERRRSEGRTDEEGS